MSPGSNEGESKTGERPTDRLDRRRFLGAVAGAGASVAFASGVAASGPIENADDENRQTLSSPDGRVELRVDVTDGTPTYRVTYDDAVVVEPSGLGFEFADNATLGENLSVSGTERERVAETWEPVWGTRAEIENEYEQLVVGLREESGDERSLTLQFRAYDDGVGFRYVLPEQEELEDFSITAENTEFRFADDYTTWWIPDDYESYEYLYEETPLSEISEGDQTQEGSTEVDGVNTPVTMRAEDDLHLSVHEAALTDYAGMTLTRIGKEETAFESTLVPWPDGTKVKGETPHASPWRTIQVGTAAELVESDLIVNLNEPSKIEDTDWIVPQKYMGIWWELHLQKSTWAPGPDVGATTGNAKRYMDFASAHGIPSLLVEGWNVGWEGGFEEWSNPPYSFDFTESIEGYDLEEVVEYGQSLDPSVDIVMHNETGGGVSNYENQIDDAFSYYQGLGIPTIKSGYVSEDGLLIDGDFYHHHGQRMVNHYRLATEKAAAHDIMLDVHEPIKPTGLRRTYPNLMTQEGVSGTEYENFREEGNPPNHTLIIPFTRMLGGPVDYTPGIFDVLYPEYKETRVHTTFAKQLALYPILFSGLQMVADLPENYDDLDAFEFVEQVPASWDDTVVENARIGESITVARRSGDEWYVGSATNEEPRTLDVSLDFLDGGKKYVAEVYADAGDVDLETNPTVVEIEECVVTDDDTIEASLAGGGGQAIRLVPATGKDAKKAADLDRYDSPEYEYDTLLVPYQIAVVDPFTVSVEVTNSGSVIGGETLSLWVDGEEMLSKVVRVGAGEERQVDFPLRLPETGDHELAVGPDGGSPVLSETVTVTPRSTEAEAFEYSKFEVPESAEVDEEIEVTVSVANTGDEVSVQIIELTADDDVIGAQYVILDPGASQDLTYTYSFAGAGTYEVALESLDARTIEVE